MSTKATTIRLSEDLQAFADHRVRTGQNASVEEVVLEALKEKRLDSVFAALDAADAEIDAGLYDDSPTEDFFAKVRAKAGLTR